MLICLKKVSWKRRSDIELSSWNFSLEGGTITLPPQLSISICISYCPVCVCSCYNFYSNNNDLFLLAFSGSQSKWTSSRSPCDVKTIVFEDCLSLGDALREIDRQVQKHCCYMQSFVCEQLNLMTEYLINIF